MAESRATQPHDFRTSNPVFDRGLLEQPLLRLCSDQLLDQQGYLVGSVQLHLASWPLNWFRPTIRTVHEAFEQPVVFSLRRTWSLVPLWEVREAEERLIGWVNRQRAWDRHKEVLFRVDPQQVYRSERGTSLGAIRGSCLQFDPLTNGQPFVRMLMLGVAMVRMAIV